MLLIVNFNFADSYPDAYVTGDNSSNSLEIASVWNANQDPLFVLSSAFQGIDYTKSTVQFESQKYDLSIPGQSENFNLYVNSNFSLNFWTQSRNFNLNIYFSEYFVPVDKTLYDEGNYPIINLSLNAVLNSETFRFWFTDYRYIEATAQNQSAVMDYGGYGFPARRYRYSVKLPGGKNSLDLIDFNFSWTGYTTPVNRYWDMEAYVRVEITSS